jgi:hypothetical protein
MELRRLQDGGEQAGEKERVMAGQKDIFILGTAGDNQVENKA